MPHAVVTLQFAAPPEDELDDPDDDPDDESDVLAVDESTEPSGASFPVVVSTPDSVLPLLEEILPLLLEPELLPLLDAEPLLDDPLALVAPLLLDELLLLDPDDESDVLADDESTEPSDASFPVVASTPDPVPPLLEEILPLLLEPELLPLLDPLPLLAPAPELLPASDPLPPPPSAPSLTTAPSCGATSALASEPVIDESAP